MKHLGFTGTREELSYDQLYSLFCTLMDLKKEGYVIFHHGDCVGADETAHSAAKALGYRIFIHPPKVDKFRAFCSDPEYIYEPREYLERNQAIVDNCDLLLAVPKSKEPELRSGTWSTIRYAEKIGREIIKIPPFI